MAVVIKKAVKQESKLRMAIMGPSGSGKTMTSLIIASALAGDQSVIVIDTERGSASKYADAFGFDVIELATFSPESYIEAIHAAEEGGYSVLVIDSISHEWAGPGGVLEIVDAVTRRSQHKNSFMSWGEVTPRHTKFVDAITSATLHVIVTMRSKQEYALEKDERTGKTSPRKVGMAPIQRDLFEYEMDVVAEMDIENVMSIHKSRCPALSGKVISQPGTQVAETLATWLAGAPAPERPAAPVQQPRPLQSVPKPEAQPAGPAPINDGQKAQIKRLSDALKRHEPDMSSLDAASANQLIRSLQADLDAKKPSPSSEAAPATDEPPANEQQMTSIRKLCAALGREEPDPAQLTFKGAAAFIRQLSVDYNARKRAS